MNRDPSLQSCDDDLLPLGRIIKPHGVKGKMKVDYYGEDPGRLLIYQTILIRDENGRLQGYEVLEAIPQPPRILIRLRGIERMEDTLPLLGRTIFIPKGSLPEPGPGEFYWHEILGMDVEIEDGRRIGKVKEIIPTLANDVYVVKGRKREICLPAIAEVIQRIDRQERVIRIKRTEGLWERDDEV